MKTKMTTLSAAVLLGISSLASATTPPPVPGIYAKGPAEPRLNMTNMRDAEKAAFALNEAMLQAAESVIYVKGCSEFTVPVEVYSYPGSNTHYIEDQSYGGIELTATPLAAVNGFGQSFDVNQATQGILNGTPVQGVKGRYTYNSVNNMMVGEKTGIQVKGQNKAFDQFYSTVIKDFYHGGTYDQNGDVYEIIDYGIQSLSKFGYPVNKWWQQSKTVRDDGQQGCTVFQKDRLVGTGACRITLSTKGLSQPDLFWQTGTLKVSKVLPGAASEISSCNVNPIFELPTN
jgi:hypothetical protein